MSATALPSPNVVLPVRRDADLSPAEAIRRERQPLPAHDLDAVNYRTWAAAVCQAEVAHRDRDWSRAVHALNLHLCFDRFREPYCVEVGQFSHECHAGAALNWLSHLQTHDSKRRGPWSDWGIYSREEKVEWLNRRRHLVHGFLRQVRRYKAARASLAAPVPVLAMREAA